MDLKYEVLIFDADGTLFDFAKAEEHAFFETAEAFGQVFDRKTYDFYARVNEAIWKEMELGEIDQETLKAERFRRFFRRLGLETDAEAFSRTYLHRLSRQGFLFPGVEKLLENLKGACRMVLLTNGLTSVQAHRLGTSPIRPFFEELVISESVGVSKPDPAIFAHTFRLLGIDEKAGSLMIGDSLTSDIRGGIGFGIDTCWYNPAGKPGRADIIPTYEVRDYAGLLGILNDRG